VRTRKVRTFLAIFFEENCLPDDRNALLIAKDDHLAGVFDGAVSAPFQLSCETAPANQPFNVFAFSADHPTARSRAGLEQLLQPPVGPQKGGKITHDKSLP
jgi:hypothetical protein